jgi:hypothetical protein
VKTEKKKDDQIKEYFCCQTKCSGTSTLWVRTETIKQNSQIILLLAISLQKGPLFSYCFEGACKLLAIIYQSKHSSSDEDKGQKRTGYDLSDKVARKAPFSHIMFHKRDLNSHRR